MLKAALLLETPRNYQQNRVDYVCVYKESKFDCWTAIVLLRCAMLNTCSWLKINLLQLFEKNANQLRTQAYHY